MTNVLQLRLSQEDTGCHNVQNERYYLGEKNIVYYGWSYQLISFFKLTINLCTNLAIYIYFIMINNSCVFLIHKKCLRAHFSGNFTPVYFDEAL